MCHVRNHSPICSCPAGHTGSPFSHCTVLPPRKPVNITKSNAFFNSEIINFLAPINDKLPQNPCFPTPCGPYSQCLPNGELPICSCLSNYYGAPPNCHPECTINADCPSNKACLNQVCRDPCPGSCGLLTTCHTMNHSPICVCIDKHIGDPFTSCHPVPVQSIPPPINDDPCNPSPCGSNTNCNSGVCSCIPQYHGDPYIGCRPECVLNSDCAINKACIRNKCADPCLGTCGNLALCEVINHVPMCSCPQGLSGNAFVQCRPIATSKQPKKKNAKS